MSADSGSKSLGPRQVKILEYGKGLGGQYGLEPAAERNGAESAVRVY